MLLNPPYFEWIFRKFFGYRRIRNYTFFTVFSNRRLSTSIVDFLQESNAEHDDITFHINDSRFVNMCFHSRSITKIDRNC